MKKLLLTIVVLVVVVASWIFLKNRTDVVSETPTSTVSPSPVVSNNLITYTDSGYVPSTITTKKGETVVWKNESSMKMWTASAVHPTHRAYPGTDIAACGTQTLLPMFDACTGITSGQSWSFTFNNIGTWKYHNHLNPSHFGTIIIVE